MENNLNDKRSWCQRREDRRKKDGSIEDRKNLSSAIRAGRMRMAHHFKFCTCQICELRGYAQAPWWFRFLRKIGILITLLFVLQSSSFAYTASWYGTTQDNTDPWKHTTTANGEHFNENALTAASWKYPFGTRVRVTNIATGCSVVVRINDRGPGKRLYRKGRIIDLTRGSFSRIAPLSDGVIHIQVSVL